jgi:hypothetical protein
MKLVLFSLVAPAAVFLAAAKLPVDTLHMQTKSAPSGHTQYVAMGSSFGAAPGVGTRAPDSPAPCNRSADNYAHLLAQKRSFALTDVTCGGATTKNILSESQRSLPPQLEAVGPETKLVTVTIGGNDVSLTSNLFAWSCENGGQRISDELRAQVCRAHPTPATDVDQEFSGLEGNMRAIVDGIHQRSPTAKVIFVDYVTILPSAGSCPDKLLLNGEELDQARSIVDRLAALTAKVSEETGSGLVRASYLTEGHDICSADPWVFGFEFSPPGTFGPTAYHPKAPAMNAIAEMLDQMLPKSF